MSPKQARFGSIGKPTAKGSFPNEARMAARFTSCSGMKNGWTKGFQNSAKKKLNSQRFDCVQITGDMDVDKLTVRRGCTCRRFRLRRSSHLYIVSEEPARLFSESACPLSSLLVTPRAPPRPSIQTTRNFSRFSPSVVPSPSIRSIHLTAGCTWRATQPGPRKRGRAVSTPPCDGAHAC